MLSQAVTTVTGKSPFYILSFTKVTIKRAVPEGMTSSPSMTSLCGFEKSSKLCPGFFIGKV